MSKPTIRIHNAQNNEIIDREMTDAEHQNHLDLIEKEKLATEMESALIANKIAAENKLKALGLTPEDLKALGLV